ncbi:MAG: NAD(P)H-dependent oxidoreductase subunit E [Candidatus Brockarchaeota archaeon]|nr:NAD(P)H-dependent oxidoreductase subunit E [Candidatus Brockarchaeota archaeon]
MSLDERISKVLSKIEPKPHMLISALQSLQDSIGYLPEQAIKAAAERVGVPVSKAYGVATFYHQFSLKPIGKYLVEICFGTACHVMGAPDVYREFEKVLGLEEGEDTTSNLKFTLRKVRCMGCCSLAPVVRIHRDIYGKVKLLQVKDIVAKYE